MKEIHNFIDKSICDLIIQTSTPGFKKAKVVGDQLDGGEFRIADSYWFDNTDDISKRVRGLISEEVGISINNMERLHIVRYKIGGEYKEHYDFFDEGSEYYHECTKKGGQRTKTALIYLNDDFTGGETSFPILGIDVKPEVGKMIVWDNMDEFGCCKYESLHAGRPVLSGEKYIAIVWFRQNSIDV